MAAREGRDSDGVSIRLTAMKRKVCRLEELYSLIARSYPEAEAARRRKSRKLCRVAPVGS